MPHQQRGFILIMVLAVMMIIALMVIAGSQSASTEMRMSTNNNDRTFAFSLAEKVLREAELDAEQRALNHIPNISKGNIEKFKADIPDYPAVFTQLLEGGPQVAGIDQPFTTSCNNGLCAPLVSIDGKQYGGNTAAWERENVFTGTMTNSIESTTERGNAIRQPRYIIEFLGRPKTDSAANFRITIRAWGANENTIVTLQSYVAVSPPPP